MGNKPSRTSLPRPDFSSSDVSTRTTLLEGVELESLLPITGSRYAVHLMPSYTEAWITGPQAASINKQRLLDKYRLLEGYTGIDLRSGTYGMQKPQNATNNCVPVAMPLLSSYTPREPPTKPPVIPGHTTHSSLSLLHKRMHADEDADFDETLRIVLPDTTPFDPVAPNPNPSSEPSTPPHLPPHPSVPALPTPTSPYINLRVVPERVVASLAFDGEHIITVGHAWRVKLALERLLMDDQLLLPDAHTGTGTGGGTGTGIGADVEWFIAQYEYAPLAVTGSGILTGTSTGKGKGGGRGRRTEVWVVLDAVNNPRLKAAVAHERRKMNHNNAIDSSARNDSNGSLSALHEHPRSVVV